MKVNLILTSDRQWIACDSESQEQLVKFEVGVIHCHDIKVNQNYALHKKIFGFFAFCTNYYYGDIDASKCPYQLDRLRKKLTVAAGYHKQVFNRDGINFEIVALSLKYESMPYEDRQVFYKRITQAALDNIFNDGADDNTMNQLLSWF